MILLSTKVVSQVFLDDSLDASQKQKRACFLENSLCKVVKTKRWIRSECVNVKPIKLTNQLLYQDEILCANVNLHLRSEQHM